MAKKVKAIVKLQIPAGKANPAPPIGPALAQHGINLMQFCKEYNARTSTKVGEIIPAEITIFQDGSFKFLLKTPPSPESPGSLRARSLRSTITSGRRSSSNAVHHSSRNRTIPVVSVCVTSAFAYLSTISPGSLSASAFIRR